MRCEIGLEKLFFVPFPDKCNDSPATIHGDVFWLFCRARFRFRGKLSFYDCTATEILEASAKLSYQARENERFCSKEQKSRIKIDGDGRTNSYANLSS